MATRTFSGRAEADKIAFADALAERSYGISYGQYCASVLLDYVYAQHSLPDISPGHKADERRAAALARMRVLSERLRGSRLASMNDDEVKQAIASRYE